MQIVYDKVVGGEDNSTAAAGGRFGAVIGTSKGEIEDLRDYFEIKKGLKEGKDVMYLIQYNQEMQKQIDEF